jgi:hypothetical protein
MKSEADGETSEMNICLESVQIGPNKVQVKLKASASDMFVVRQTS